MGFPLLIKAVLGGGGKGMKLARAPDELEVAPASQRCIPDCYLPTLKKRAVAALPDTASPGRSHL